jgi:nucleoporin POM152
VDLIFTGEAPYWIEYVLERRALDDRGAVERYPREREVYSKHRSLLVLKPKQPGNYRYIFERVGDKNYNDGISLSESSLTQIIHPHSTAYFVFSKRASTPYKFVKCKGDKVKLQVGVEGSGPWEVLYEISHTVTKRFTRAVEASSKGFEIEIENLDVAGIYTVDLVGK